MTHVLSLRTAPGYDSEAAARYKRELKKSRRPRKYVTNLEGEVVRNIKPAKPLQAPSYYEDTAALPREGATLD